MTRCLCAWQPKPDPDPYLKAAELLGVPISSCLVLEDALLCEGIRMAHTGVVCVVQLQPALLS